MARLTKIHIENFKRIKLIEYSPTGNVTLVGGMNEQGKSSMLDSISLLLEGKAAKIPEPVRTGAKKAKIVGEISSDSWDAFGDCIITRTISAAGNWSVKIQDKDGKTVKSPESVLRKIFGEPVDPVAFVRMSDKEQVETFKSITGLDFTELDAKRLEHYDNRTLIGREVKILEGAIASAIVYPDAPKEKVKVYELMTEMERMDVKNDKNKKARAHLQNYETDLLGRADDIKDLQDQITDLQQKLKTSEELYTKYTNLCDVKKNEVNALEDEDTEVIKTKIKTADETNIKIAANFTVKTQKEELSEKQKKYDGHTTSIVDIDDNKKHQMASINFPVPGLSFNDETVLYKGLPFDEKQLSSEELIRVSFAISIAAQPNLKNILIKEGSLLDKNNLKLIAEMAEENDIHVFIEVVGDNAGKSTIVIENGAIKKADSTIDDQVGEDDFSDI